MNQHQKVFFVRMRVSKIERDRIEKIMSLTHQKRSEIYRAALFEYIKKNHPEILVSTILEH